VPEEVGVVPLLTLSYMYEAPGVNVSTNQIYPIRTYGSSSSAGQQILFYNNSDTVLSFYNYNPFIQLVQNAPVTKNTYLSIVGESPYGSASVVQLINYINPDNNKGGSGLLWLWILLGVLGGIILLGVVYYYIKRRMKMSLDYGNEPYGNEPLKEV
jgi:hypothetical protein